MSLLNDILVWASDKLTLWQRDGLRRLFLKQELSSQDYDDLYAMLKSAQGLNDDDNRQPVPLAKEHLPARATNESPVVLRALRDLKNVNRIESGQELKFSPKGVTVIYGGTGSGKSGYARVLKQACRARDLSETVHPDASDPAAVRSIPEATFDIEVGGIARSLIWTRGSDPPDELSTIAVFDGRCARAYLDDEQDVAYLPYGLDIIESLAKSVLPSLLKRLEAEIDGIDTDTRAFTDLLGDTAVGRLVKALSARTDSEAVAALGTLSAEEKKRLLDLDKTLSEQDPMATAVALLLSEKRINGLIIRVEGAIAVVDDLKIEKLRVLDIETEAACAAEAVAASGFRSKDSLLPGTGEGTWNKLFEAARRFSVEDAYPGKPFPYVDGEAKCLLCQQPLAASAAERMRHFESFVKQDTATVAAEKREQLATAVQQLDSAIVTFGLDDPLSDELTTLNSASNSELQALEKRIQDRKSWMLRAVKDHIWTDAPTIDGNPNVTLRDASTSPPRLASEATEDNNDSPNDALKSSPAESFACKTLRGICSKLRATAAELKEAFDETRKKALESERAELRACAKLSPRVQAISDLIARMGKKAKLAKCKADLKTKAISDKAKEFASQAVTKALKKALDAEFEGLGVDRIKTKLNERVTQGQMKHKLILDLPVTKRLDEILSEGEQRGIAIGSFLAELHLAGHNNGIVFDDPVSSLDHDRRKNVACRLVAEGKKRQVIIFTHDTVFLSELLHETEDQNVDSLMHHLEWSGQHAGHVNEGLPWEHQKYAERLSKLAQSQKELLKRWPLYPNAEDKTEMRQQYDRLRATIERVIQDVVFNGVVQRYRDWIKVGQLSAVVGFTEAERAAIARLHKVCCDVVTAHDPPSGKNSPVPSAKQLGDDISALATVVETIKARRKARKTATVV